MLEEATRPLRVEALKAQHLLMFLSGAQKKYFYKLQGMLLRNWAAKLEENLSAVLPSKQSCFFIAIEKDSPISLVEVYPYNSRGSCWVLTMPQPLSISKQYSQREVLHMLLKRALQHGNEKAKSWILRCNANNLDYLSLARELGFQPLKHLQTWSPPLTQKNIKPSPLDSYPKNIYWQKLSRKTAPLLWPLVKAEASVHLRQITDRSWHDLLFQNKHGSGVLISKKDNSAIAIAGLLGSTGSASQPLTLQLLRDTSWDSRLSEVLPKTLNDLLNTSKNILLETSIEDEKTTHLLKQHNWEKNTEEILLGKSLWKRQLNNKLIPGSKSLESMLGRLQPQTPPLPTPSLGPR